MRDDIFMHVTKRRNVSAAAARRNSSSSDNMTQFKKRGNSLVFRIDLLLRSLDDSLARFARFKLLLWKNQA